MKCPHALISRRPGDLDGRVVLRCQACGLERERAADMRDLSEFWPELAAEAGASAEADGVSVEHAAARIGMRAKKPKDKDKPHGPPT